MYNSASNTGSGGGLDEGEVIAIVNGLGLATVEQMITALADKIDYATFSDAQNFMLDEIALRATTSALAAEAAARVAAHNDLATEVYGKADQDALTFVDGMVTSLAGQLSDAVASIDSKVSQQYFDDSIAVKVSQVDFDALMERVWLLENPG